MLTRRSALLGTGAAVLLGRQAKAYVSEAKGYFTFEMLAVVNNPRDPLLAGFASGRYSRYDSVDGENLAVRVHQEAKAGQIAFYPGYLTVLVCIWGASGRGLELVRSYSNPHGGLRTERAIRPTNRTFTQTALGPPQYIYWARARGKDMSIAFPVEFFTPETQILVCAPWLTTLRPDSAREQGIWFTTGTLPWFLAHKRGVTTFFLVDQNHRPDS